MTRRFPEADTDAPTRHTPQNRREAESKLRRGGRHCPVCLQPLVRISGKGRFAHKCAVCGAQPQQSRRCAKCNQEAVWEVNARAACQACGHHGSRIRVIAAVFEDAAEARKP